MRKKGLAPSGNGETRPQPWPNGESILAFTTVTRHPKGPLEFSECLGMCLLRASGSKHAHTPQVKYIIAILCTKYVHGHQADFVFLIFITDMVWERLPVLQGPVAAWL